MNRRALVVVLLAAQAAHADERIDVDGDGDIDVDDDAALRAAEQITIVDKSAGRQATDSARAVSNVDTKLARERSADLGEVLARQQGIQLRRFGGLGSATRFTLDGLSDDQIRFFLDGLPLELVGWGLGVANVPLSLVDRVEVHHGVVPVALGADALGGAIDLVTDPAWFDHAALSYEVGSFGTHRGAATARVRDPDSGLVMGGALVFDRARNDFDVDVEIPDALGRKQPRRVPRFHDGYTAGAANLEAGIVERGPIERAIVRVFETDYTKELQTDAVMSQPYGEVTYGETARGAVLDLQLSAGRWGVRAAAGLVQRWIDFHDVSTHIYDWTGAIIGERQTPGELGGATDQRIRQRAAFVRLVGAYTRGAHVLRLALAPTFIHRTGTDFTDTDPTTRDPLTARRELLQVVLGVEEQARIGRVENIAFAKAYGNWLDAEQLRPGFVFEDVSRSLRRYGAGDAVRLKLTEAVALKASYEWSVRLPSVDEVFGNGVLVRDNLALAPERSHNLNLGVRYDGETSIGSIGAELSSFARFADNMIVLIGGDRFTTYQNVFAARILGISGGGRWDLPGRWLSLDGSITAQDIRNVSDEGAFGRFEGDRIPNRPWLLGSLGATARARDVLLAGDELAGFVQSRYVRSFFRGWESLGQAATKQTIPSQLVHAVGLTYALRRRTPVVWTLEVQNVTDASAYDSYGSQRPGRAMYLKVSTEL